MKHAMETIQKYKKKLWKVEEDIEHYLTELSLKMSESKSIKYALGKPS